MAKIFGIDLGTTYSCIAYVDEYGKPEVVNNQESSPVTPSVVSFSGEDAYCVGEAAKNELEQSPEHVCSVIKRQMGSRTFKFEAYGKEYTPEAISSLILKKLASDAGDIVGEEVKNVVITCPAYFGLDEREATKQAGKFAGFNVLAILNEPTAAAISYGLRADNEETVMVFDLGGGTFDVTVLTVGNGVFRTIVTEGDHQLGGKDWDADIRDYVVSEYCAATGNSADSIYDDAELMGYLELKCESAKKMLTPRETAKIRLEGQTIEITRAKFDELTKARLDQTLRITQKAIDGAKKKGTDKIDKILLVGGSTRMPQVMERLQQEYSGTPIEFCDPDQSVAKGAAIYGINAAAYPEHTDDETDEGKPVITDKEKEEIQNNPIFTIAGKGNATQEGIKIGSVISQSIAVRLICSDNQSHIVNQIFRNTEIPLTHELHAGTQEPNQTSVLIEIFENSDDELYVEEEMCKKLVEGELSPLPANLPANAPIDIVFNIDKNGMMSIDAEYKPGNMKTHLEVKLANSMTEEELQEQQSAVNSMRMV